MKFIVISDIHGDVDTLDEFLAILQKDPERKILLIAGDLGDISGMTKKINKVFEKVYFVPGNDDPPNISFYGFQNIDKEMVVLNREMILIGLGGSPPAGIRSLYNWSDEDKSLSTLMWRLFLRASRYKLPIVFLSHCPPYGYFDLATFYGQRHIGSKIIKNLVETFYPRLHFFGHVHRDGGKVKTIGKGKTKLINVSLFSGKSAYKALGRRYLEIRKKGSKMKIRFKYVVNPSLSVEKFVDTYL